MSLYDFETNESLEADGIWLVFPGFRVKIASAGTANKSYVKLLEAKTKPLKRMIALDMVPPDKQLQIVREVYAATVIRGWETEVKQDDGSTTYVTGIEDKDMAPSLRPATPENYLWAITKFKIVFNKIQEAAQDAMTFRSEVLEENAKNS